MAKLKKQAASIADYAELFKSDIGQKVLYDLLRCHGVLGACHVPGDPYSTAFNDGARSVVLRIMKRSKMDINAFLKAVDEMNKSNEEDL